MLRPGTRWPVGRGWTRRRRRLLVACGGGAGMGAVHNVPLGGALITADLLYGQLILAVLLPALTCSVVATTVGWAYLPTHATYSGVATFDMHATQVGCALVARPLIGLLPAALVRTSRTRRSCPPGTKAADCCSRSPCSNRS